MFRRRLAITLITTYTCLRLLGLPTLANFLTFLARDVIYTSRAYATMSVSVCPSVCDGSSLWSRCMPGRAEGSSRAMLATARPSRYFLQLPYWGRYNVNIVKYRGHNPQPPPPPTIDAHDCTSNI